MAESLLFAPRALSLERNSVGDEGARALGDALQANTSLKELE
jgi:hypothetical protein